MAKTLVKKITKKEIKEILGMIERDSYPEYKITERDNRKIRLTDGTGNNLTIYNDGITFSNQVLFGNSEFSIEQSFQVAQYLIDRGYKFEYKN
jgi:hypothetical protein